MGQLEMTEYNPSLKLCDGIIYDMVIEDVLSVIYHRKYDDPLLDEAYNSIVRSYINEDCPFMLVSKAGKSANNMAMAYITMLGLDYTVIHRNSRVWPVFSDMDNALVAISIHNPNDDTQFDYTPGIDLNQAALAAIIQVARELAINHHNQLDLPIKYDA